MPAVRTRLPRPAAAVKRLGGYVRMSIEDRREAVKELAAQGESMRAIAEVLGTSKSAVARDIAVPNGTDDDAEASESAGDGRETVPNGTPLSAVAALAAEDEVRAAARIAERRQASEEKRKG